MVRFRYRTRKKNVDDYILHGGEAIGFPEHVRFLDNETDGQKTQRRQSNRNDARPFYP